MYLSQHLPIFQVLVPLFVALLNVFSFDCKRAYFLTIVAALSSLFISIFLFLQITTHYPIYYNVGDWQGTIGIEYKLFPDNIKLLLCLNFIFLIFTLLILPAKLEHLSRSKYGYLLYSLLLLFHAGALGIIITNDIFNLYVAIEIMALSSYSILSYSDNKKSLIAALDYLIIGSIAATLILLAIGIIFYITGSLNIDMIHAFLQQHDVDRNLLKFAISLICVGIFVKIALFPFNTWMVNLYSVADVDVLSYIASVATMTNFYIFIKLTYYAIPYEIAFEEGTRNLIIIIANASILFCAYNACLVKNFRNIVINSAAVSAGYMCLIYLNSGNTELILIYLVADAISKFAVFNIIKYTELRLNQKNHTDSKIFSSAAIVFMIVVVINNAGLPLTVNFLNKANLLSSLLGNYSYYSFGCIIISSFLSLIYNYRILEPLFFDKAITQE